MGPIAHPRIPWLQNANLALLMVYTIECACRAFVERSLYAASHKFGVVGQAYHIFEGKKVKVFGLGDAVKAGSALLAGKEGRGER